MVICLLLGSAIFSFMVFWLLLSLTVFLISLSIAVKKTFIKYLCIGLFSITLPVSVLEAYFWISFEAPVVDTLVETDSAIPAHIMADLNPKDTYTRRHAIRTFTATDTKFFDVTFTYNSEGQRITPYAPKAKTAVVLMGCSFTFSDGLKDEQAFAYQLGKKLGSDYQVFNLGKNGSGSHRVLESLEQGMPNLKKYSNVLFYYFAMDDHLQRISGAAYWDHVGPMYDVRDGKAIRIGTFMDIAPFYKNKHLFFWVKRSHIYKKLNPYLHSAMAKYLPRNTKEKKLELQVALITSMNEQIHKDYPQSTFTVLLWPPDTAEPMTPFLQHIPHIDMEKWFPQYKQHMEKYVIAYPHETHPSAHANDIVAHEMTSIVQNDVKKLSSSEHP